MKSILAPVLCLALAVPTWAQDPPLPPVPEPVVPMAIITAPETIPAGSPYLVVLGDESISKGPLSWSMVKPRGTPFKLFEGKCLVIKDPVPGATYQVALQASGDNLTFAFAMVEIVVGKTPDPTPPTPAPTPGPTPGPSPTPGPTPTPPVPDKIGNLRVVILYERWKPQPVGVTAVIMGGGGVLQYLERKCIKGLDGKAEWRIWDQHEDVSRESPEWQDAMKAALADPKPVPKVCAFAGNVLVESRAVITPADFLAFLKSKAGD